MFQILNIPAKASKKWRYFPFFGGVTPIKAQKDTIQLRYYSTVY